MDGRVEVGGVIKGEDETISIGEELSRCGDVVLLGGSTCCMFGAMDLVKMGLPPRFIPFDPTSASAHILCSKASKAVSEPPGMMVTRTTGPKWEKISRIAPALGKKFGSCGVRN